METRLHDFSNKTEFALKSDAERYTWIVFHIFVALSSLIGDSLILIASIKYKAFKINRLILVTIKHIAISDISVVLFNVIPRIVALIINHSTFENVLCKIKACLSYYVYVVAVFQMCAMTTCKVATLQYPLRTNSLSSRDAHKGCIGIWLSVLSFPAFIAFDINSDAVFDYRMYMCDISFKGAISKWLRPMATLVYSGIPNILVTASTIRLLMIARQSAVRQNRKVNLQGVITVILVAVVYHVSLLPYTIYSIAKSRVAVKTNFFHKEFYRVSVSFLLFNTISNFFIYCVTIDSFRQFICRLVPRSSRTSP